MKLHLHNSANQKTFTAHGAGYVTVSGQRFEHSVVVAPKQVYTDWGASAFDALTEEHFAFLLALKPEIVLLGTAAQQRFAHPRLYQQLTMAGIGVECMDTAAACRTYNILVGEDRAVIAAILL